MKVLYYSMSFILVAYGVLEAQRSVSRPIVGQVVQVQSIDRFDRVINDYSMAVVYLYEIEPGTREGKRFSVVDDNHETLDTLSRRLRYQRAGVGFVSANLMRDDLQQLKKRYNITGTDMLLFMKDGTLYGKDRLTGLFNRNDVRRLMNKNFGDYIEDILEELEEIQQQREARARERRPVPTKTTYVTYAPYWGGPYWGAPYYGYYRYPYYQRSPL